MTIDDRAAACTINRNFFDLAVNDVNGVYKTAPTSGVSPVGFVLTRRLVEAMESGR